jgi:hypothetical protein
MVKSIVPSVGQMKALDAVAGVGESTPMVKTLLMLLTLAVAALGADVTGNWKATAEGPNGQMERTFVFKQDGAKVTGETVRNEIKFTVEVPGDGQTIEWLAKKVS